MTATEKTTTAPTLESLISTLGDLHDEEFRTIRRGLINLETVASAGIESERIAISPEDIGFSVRFTRETMQTAYDKIEAKLDKVFDEYRAARSDAESPAPAAVEISTAPTDPDDEPGWVQAAEKRFDAAYKRWLETRSRENDPGEMDRAQEEGDAAAREAMATPVFIGYRFWQKFEIYKLAVQVHGDASTDWTDTRQIFMLGCLEADLCHLLK